MDNFSISLVSDSFDDLQDAIAIALKRWRKSGVAGFIELNTTRAPSGRFVPDENGVPTLILTWYGDSEGIHKLSLPHHSRHARNLVEQWLKRTSYSIRPECDAKTEKGFLLFRDEWGGVCGNPYGIVGIRPAWAYYGK